MTDLDLERVRHDLRSGSVVLGIEFGSTRIKSVLIGADFLPLASGSHEWENRYEGGVWTYRLDDVWAGLQDSYRQVSSGAQQFTGEPLSRIGALGLSGMMHGYLALDEQGELLAPFRTWRNTMTGEACAALTELFQFNIPQRWSIAHLYQAILNGEPHVRHIRRLTTLAGYVHARLTGEHVLGVGEASGMFPIDSETGDYDERLIERFDERLRAEGLPFTLRQILPEVRGAGEAAGHLTEAGARLLDPDGSLQAGIPLCPPEGDAGTGMVATNAVAERTGNVSAGTSVFAMIVLERPLSQVHPEIDLVTTPTGRPVAMVHSNNCTSDLNAWVELFGEFAQLLGHGADASRLYEMLYRVALLGDADAGGLLAVNYVSGEHLTGLEEGRPLFVRRPESAFTLANFMRAHLFAALASLRIGLNILLEQEQVQVDRMLGHGGFFKTPEVGQRMMAAAFNTPVSVMTSAGEGGAWGIALLAAYLLYQSPGETLDAFLDERVFAGQHSHTVAPDAADVAGFAAFMARFQRGLAIERAAVAALNDAEGD